MTLKSINADLLRDARQSEGHAVRRYLPHGLVREVVQLRSGDVKLTLSRLDVDPGLNEWQIVLKYWPEPVPAGIVPLRNTEGRMHRLYASWPRPAIISETA